MADATFTLQQYVTVSPQLAKSLGVSMKVALNECALVITKAARREVVRDIGSDQLLSGMPNAKKIQPYFVAARNDRTPVAVIRAKGPWQFIENPRKGGYQIRPRDKKALATPEGPRGGATGGAITSPLRPIRRTYERAPQFIRQIAPGVVDAEVKQALVKVKG